MGFVFGMALEKHEQALALLHERVGARRVRPREHPIAAGGQGLLGDVVPPRMRHPQAGRRAGGQGMIGDAHALEDPEALVVERAPVDAIEVQERGVRGQTGPDGGVGLLLGRLQDADQAPPVRLVPEVRRPRLGPGHDEAVEPAAPERAEPGIEAGHVLPAPLRARDLRQRVGPQPHPEAVRRRPQQGDELAFRRLERRLDGLIVTGTEPRSPNLRDEPYWGSLISVLEWAEQHTYSAVWSCLATHAALLHLDGIDRRPLDDKRFGVFECVRVDDHPLTAGAPARRRTPPSRWNAIPDEAVAPCPHRLLTRT